MRFLGKNFDDIGIEDLETLITDKRREDLTLDYKEELPGKTDKDKRDFLKDVSSFANKTGGVIIYGIAESRDKEGQPTGIPARIVGVGDVNRDNWSQKLEAMMRSSLFPSLTQPKLRFVGEGKSQVLILAIPRSYFGPHMVGQEDFRFWVRTSTGNARMHVTEIRRAILDSEDWGREAERFRMERVTDVWYNSSISGLVREQGLFLHALPVGQREPLMDLRSTNKLLNVVDHMLNVGPSASYNVDGIRRWAGTGECRKYIQLFRNGGIEFYTQLGYSEAVRNGQSVMHVDGADMWYKCVYFLHGVSVFAEICPLDGPFLFAISVLGCEGWHANVQGVPPSGHYTFDRDEVMLPLVSIDDFPIDLGTVFGDAMTFLWQASGWPASPFAKQRTAETINALPSKEEMLRSI